VGQQEGRETQRAGKAIVVRCSWQMSGTVGVVLQEVFLKLGTTGKGLTVGQVNQVGMLGKAVRQLC
jgi:hypothetical protein